MYHRPPDLSATTRWLVAFATAARRWPRWGCWALTIGGLAIALAIDAWIGLNANLIVLYLIVAGFASWALGEQAGTLASVGAVIASAIIKHVERVHLPADAAPLATELWNALARLISVWLMVVAINGMRSALDLEHWRASIDGLTGVLNKAAFQRRMERRIAYARHHGLAVVLCYMDLDGFKRVNDRHGHSAGDQVLRGFATAAVNAIRERDLFARIGGDEFVALLTVPSPAEGDRLAEIIHARLSRILAETGLGVTCSMGALVMDSGELDSAGGYIELADKLMYEVKHSCKDALRIGRIDPIGTTLASAFPPDPTSEFDALIAAIDRADQTDHAEGRRAA